MEYPRFGGKAPSVRSIAPSVYSHHSRVTTRSSANLRSTHSMRSVVIPWYRKPILQDAILLDIQRASMLTACYSLVKLINKFTSFCIKMSIFLVQFLGLFTLVTAVFDIYCLAEAAPGSTHYGYYIISFEFVYVGNMHGNRKTFHWECRIIY